MPVTAFLRDLSIHATRDYSVAPIMCQSECLPLAGLAVLIKGIDVLPDNRRVHRKFIGGAIAIAFVAVAIWLATRDESSIPTDAYAVATVLRGDIVQSVSTTGRLKPLVTVEISSQISGLVREVAVDFNAAVRRGQVLARIDPATYEQRLQQTTADLTAAEATYELAGRTVARLRALREQDLVTAEEYDQAQALEEQSHATLLTRRAALENARVDLQRCVITAPIDGVVIYKDVEVGKTIVSSFTAPTLFVIARDLSRMRIEAPIPEVDISSIHVGQPAMFTVDSFPGHRFEGRVMQIRSPYTPSEKQPEAASQTGATSFQAVIEVDNSDRLLRPSLTANVSIVIAAASNTLRIPNGALRISLQPGTFAARPEGQESLLNDASSVPTLAGAYRLPGGVRNATPERVQVKIGLADSLNTEVRGGLSEGDLVITGFQNRIQVQRRQGLFD